MRLMAGLSVGKVVGRWARAGVLAARPRAVATVARAAVRRMVEDMGGDEWVVVGAGMEDSARWRGRLRASAPLGRWAVAFFLAYDVATLSARLMDYGVIHTDFGLRFSLADGTSAPVPYVEGAFSGRAWYQATYTNERAFTGNAATFGGGIQHFVDHRIALDAGLLFSHGTFTDATVNGASVPDYHGDAVWSSRFNLGGRMYFR
jgi:hypothetical protein